MNCSCGILARGRNTRVGENKTIIKIGEKAMINLVYNVVKKICDDVIIVSGFHNTTEGIGALVLKDAPALGASITGIAALHAIYNRPCAAYFFWLIEQNRPKIVGILAFVSVKELEEGPRFFVNNRSVFTNINTISDLETVQGG